MDQNSVASYDVADDAEYIANFRTLPEATAPLPNTLFANPVWGTEGELSSTTFTPGVYLHNRDAAYGYLDPHDTASLTDWAKGVPSDLDQSGTTSMNVTPPHSHYQPTASPTEKRQPVWPIDANGQQSSCSSSSYMMASDATTITPPIIPGRVRLAAAHSTSTSGSVRSSRVSKPKSKPIGSTKLPRTNSNNSNNSSKSASSQHQNQSEEKQRSFSSASSSASPPIDESPRRSGTGAIMDGGGGSGGTGLITTGHGGNHNVTLRTASRKPKPPTAGAVAAAVVVPKTESPNSDASAGSSPSSQDGANTESLTSEERRARQNHNIVEKQYRNRLNSQFERLLSILPANQMEGSEMGRNVEFDERRMSKAEVLELARRRIHALENEIQQLYSDRENLQNNVATLNLAIQHGQQQQQQQQQQKLGITI